MHEPLKENLQKPPSSSPYPGPRAVTKGQCQRRSINHPGPGWKGWRGRGGPCTLDLRRRQLRTRGSWVNKIPGGKDLEATPSSNHDANLAIASSGPARCLPSAMPRARGSATDKMHHPQPGGAEKGVMVFCNIAPCNSPSVQSGSGDCNPARRLSRPRPAGAGATRSHFTARQARSAGDTLQAQAVAELLARLRPG